MGSSKWIQVESPSPFRFLAALMPPWAQTECERFTGTIENRSTSPPISAILITAARPARPPPTTMIFGAAMLYESNLPDWARGFLRNRYRITIFSETFESKDCGGVLRNPYMLAAPIETSPRASAKQR